jgi:hypothetical protein
MQAFPSFALNDLGSAVRHADKAAAVTTILNLCFRCVEQNLPQQLHACAFDQPMFSNGLYSERTKLRTCYDVNFNLISLHSQVVQSFTCNIIFIRTHQAADSFINNKLIPAMSSAKVCQVNLLKIIQM